MDKQNDIGIIVRHLQAKELPAADIDLIAKLASGHKQVAIFLGEVYYKATRNHPLDFETRREMVLAQFPTYPVREIKDSTSDVEWSKTLDTQIRQLFPAGSVTVYITQADFVNHYKGEFAVVKIDSDNHQSLLEEGKKADIEVKRTKEFREGVIFATQNQYAKVHPTIDIAICKGHQVLLGRKPQQEKFRFIGGFVDVSDSCYEDTAAREAKEETGVEVKDVTYIGSAKIDDWRFRKEQDKIISLLFRAEYAAGNAEAADDIEELHWFDIDALTPDMVVDEHQVLIDLFLENHRA